MKADARPSAEKEALSWAIDFFRTRARYLNPKSFRENNLKYVEQCAEDWFVLPEGERDEQLNELAELAIFDGDGFATMYLRVGDQTYWQRNAVSAQVETFYFLSASLA